MTEATIKINTEGKIDRRVDFCWPKPDTRIPEAQRPKPRLEGYVECEYRYFSHEELDEQDQKIADGELDINERFHMLVPVIKGLPLKEGQTAREWLDTFEHGVVIRNAVTEDYFEFVTAGRLGNSKKRRSR